MKDFLEKLNSTVSPNYMPDPVCVKFADKIVEHEFTVLGSKPAIIRYGMTCNGFEGHAYPNPDHSYAETRAKACAVAPKYAEFMQKAETLAREYTPDYQPIPWHLDIITGYVYDLVWHTQVPVATIEGVDAKTPSDFSRAHNLLTLAHAYRVTKDKKYRNQLASQLLDWIAVNPPYYGPAWRNGMNVSIRVTNIICAVAMMDIDLNDDKDRKFIELVRELILLHTKFIAMTIEFRSEHNHMVSEICALTLTTSLFGNGTTTEDVEDTDTDDVTLYNLALERTCWHLISKEIARQINDDGFDFENTTSYHAYVLEMFVYPTLHALRVKGCKNAQDFLTYIKNNRLIADESIEKLRKSARALCMLTQPDGNIPYISDNDAGRFIEWESRDKHPADMRSLACTVAVLFNDSSIVPYKARECDFIASKAFFDDASPIESTFEYKSQVYNHIGFTIMAKNDFHCIFRSGGAPNGEENSHIGHSHNDQLAFTLCAKGKPFFIDTGTYTYTGDKKWRRKTKSALAHNTVVIDNIETDERIAASIFGEAQVGTFSSLVNLQKNITSLVNFSSEKDKLICTGKHVGYLILPDKITVQRTLTYTDNQLEVVDEFKREDISVKEGEITERFIAHSDCKVYVKDGKAYLENDGISIEISTEKGFFRTEEAFHAINYGTRKPTTALCIVLPRDCEQNTFKIKW